MQGMARISGVPISWCQGHASLLQNKRHGAKVVVVDTSLLGSWPLARHGVESKRDDVQRHDPRSVSQQLV